MRFNWDLPAAAYVIARAEFVRPPIEIESERPKCNSSRCGREPNETSKPLKGRFS